jgi:hypothetical protein
VARVGRFDAKMAVAPLGPVSLVFVQHRGGELCANLTDELSYYDVNFSYGGRNIVTSGDASVVVDRRRAAILSPGMGADMHLSDEYRQLHLRIEVRLARSSSTRSGQVGHPAGAEEVEVWTSDEDVTLIWPATDGAPKLIANAQAPPAMRLARRQPADAAVTWVA